MASRRNKIFYAKPSLIYPSSDTLTSTTSDAVIELDESDVVWNTNQTAPSDTARKTIPTSRSYKKLTGIKTASAGGAATSLPVNIPDWSKILKGDYKERRRGNGEEDGEDERGRDFERERDERIPPHEYLARTRGASLSVHEGVGRTLKGRDLRRVRNAVWKKTGFED